MHSESALGYFRCERCFKPVTAQAVSIRTGETLCLDCSDTERLDVAALETRGEIIEGLHPTDVARLLRH